MPENIEERNERIYQEKVKDNRRFEDLWAKGVKRFGKDNNGAIAAWVKDQQAKEARQ